ERTMRILRFCAVATVATITLQPAYAEVDKEMAACAAMQNSVDRLACFDQLSSDRGAAPSVSTETPPGAGKWHTNTKTDPLTDKEVYTAIVFADSGKSKYGKPIALFVRCRDNRTDMFI